VSPHGPSLLDRIGGNPFWFHYLRKLAELNFRATKRRIGAVRDRLGAPRVLDVGCGTGEFAGLFDPARYQGIDLSERYVGFARRTYPAYRFACADAIRWAGTGERFDLLLVNGVLHHLDAAEAQALLRATARHAAPGATLLVIEDTELPDPGWATRIVHGADAGHFIRTPVAWHALVSAVTAIDRTDAYVSGACPYFLMECRVR
jgi:2-polyprenyl-3-methyl-5-hydroxy-6-metoxy-1,4-benzoquinol methylase